jgi:hypothetical protein
MLERTILLFAAGVDRKLLSSSNPRGCRFAGSDFSGGMIAALFVETNGVYFGLPGVDPWDKQRDARLYSGPWPVVAHPPCERWGRYWSGGPSAKVRRIKGDDGGCFEFALKAVRRWGGVLEHPAASHAWAAFDLRRPSASGGWTAPDVYGGRSCHVEQGHYGHRARKATWLYAVSSEFPSLTWGPSVGVRLEDGFHSSEERRLAREAGIRPVKRLSKRERIDTPAAFRDVLVELSRGSFFIGG